MPNRISTIAPIHQLIPRKQKKKTQPPKVILTEKMRPSRAIVLLPENSIRAIYQHSKRLLVSDEPLRPGKVLLGTRLDDKKKARIFGSALLLTPIPFNPATRIARLLQRFHLLNLPKKNTKLYAYPIWPLAQFEKPHLVRDLKTRRVLDHFDMALFEKANPLSPRVAIAFIFNPNGEVFLILRRNPPQVWSPPGGWVEDRHPATAALEEGEEETGLELSPLGEIPMFQFEDGTLAAGFVFLSNGTPQVNKEAKEGRFFSFNEISELTPLSPALFNFYNAINVLANPTVDFAKLEYRPETLSDEALLENDLWLHILDKTETGLHSILLAELERRGIAHPQYDTLEELSKADESLLSKLATLPKELVIVPNWVSVTGSSLWAENREPHDLDVVIREPAPPSGAFLKLTRAFQQLSTQPPHLFVDSTGPIWDFVPTYDLVARRRDQFEVQHIPESRDLYKSGLETHFTELFIPFSHYKATGEFYPSSEEDLQEWASEMVDEGLVVQEKFDGIRFIIHFHKQRGVKVFSESGRDRSEMFPDLPDTLMKLNCESAILDTEFVETEDSRPKPRWEMAWMISAKEPQQAKIRIFVHDLVFIDGNNISEQPYLERLEQLKRLIPKPLQNKSITLVPAESHIVRSLPEFNRALKWARSSLWSEGAMIKPADFRYSGTRIANLIKFKNSTEITVKVIGWKKNPTPRKPNTHWTRSEALQAFPEASKNSRTYIFRCAVLDGDKLIPIESDRHLTARDLRLDWDEKEQKWVGLEDPKLWTMCAGFKDRGEGEYAYGNTYALAMPRAPRCGDVITVAPMQFRAFRKEDGTLGYSWMFPRVRNLEEPTKPISQLDNVLRAFGVTIANRVASFEELTPPPESGKYRFVIQHHARGRSIHADLRMEFNDHLIGWTLLDQVEGLVTEPVLSLDKLKELEKDTRFWKIDWRTGNIKQRRTASGVVRRGNILAIPKANEIPADWLNVEGVTETPDPGDPPPVGGTRHFPGVFSIIDKGTVEYGSMKPYFFEYFFHGARLKGRYIVRLLEHEKATPLPPGEDVKSVRPSYFILMQPDEQRPYVLSEDAIESDFLPPHGYSALPRRIRNRVPERLRYWEMTDKKQARAARAELAKQFEELGGPDIVKEDDG